MSVSLSIAERLRDNSVADRPFLRLWRRGQRRDVSHGSFWRQVDRLATDLASASPAKRTVDLLLGETSPELMVFFVALIVAGRTPSFFPSNTAFQDRRAYFEQQRKSLANVNCSTIFTDDVAVASTVAEIDPSLTVQLFVKTPDDEEASGDAVRAASAFEDRLASNEELFAQHSSGTTGIKKGVGITGHALTAQFHAYWPAVGALAGSDAFTIASWLPLYHDMGLLTAFLLPLLGGNSVSLVDPFEWIKRPATLFDVISKDRCGVCWLPNFSLRHLVRCKPLMTRSELSSVRAWVDCSEPCRLDDALLFEETFGPWGVRVGTVVGCYAMAETVFAVTQATGGRRLGLATPSAPEHGLDLRNMGAKVVVGPTSGVSAMLSSGRALPGFELRITQEKKTLPAWHYGEIELRGPCLFESYRVMTAEQSGIDREGWYATGDLGAIVDGELYVLGRSKDVIIVNGKSLHAADIEEVVQAVSGVKPGRVVAFGLFNEGTGSEQLVILAEMLSNAKGSKSEVTSAINNRVAQAFLVTPREVRAVEERWLIKTTSGKLSRSANRDKYLALLSQTKPSERSLVPTAS